MACVERLLLLEHANVGNILVKAVTLALLASDDLSHQLNIVPRTTRFNAMFKALTVCGLALQLVFDLKNCDRTTYSPVSRLRNAMSRAGSRATLYRLGHSSLSPPPISSPSPETLTCVTLSNLTAVDRQLEGLGTSLILCGINLLMLKSYFRSDAASRAQDGHILSMGALRKAYWAVNMLGVLAAVKRLAVVVFARRLGGAAAASDASASDPPRSLPLILPSVSFLQLVHALFLHPQTRLAMHAEEGMLGAVSSAPILRAMTLLSVYLWSLHGSYFASIGVNGAPHVRNAASRALGGVSRAWRWDSPIRFNAQMCAAIIIIAKLMA
jgi:hypothetical protein